MAVNNCLNWLTIGSQLTHNRLNRFMLKARIARKKSALCAASVQKARKACNFDGGLSEVADNKKSKLPKNDRYFRKMAEKRPKQPERYKKPVDRNGAKGATIGQ